MIKTYLVLIVGVTIVASSSILIRWTGNVPPTIIAFYRVFISFIILIPYSLHHQSKANQFSFKFHWHYLLAGFFLAAHFITWIASLQMTTIANSIFLESTHPIFGIFVSILVLKEIPHKRIYPVVLIAFFGMVMILYQDITATGSELSGDLLAILSALLFALYIAIARLHRHDADFIHYLLYIYGSAALFSGLYIVVQGDHFTGYSSHSWMLMILIALGPNLLGHSILNWSSRYLQIYKVNLVMLLEPVLATMSGMFFLAEFPGRQFYIGALSIILSLWILIYGERKRYAK